MKTLLLLIFVAMISIGDVSADSMVGLLPSEGVAWLVSGGLCDAGGVVFFLWQRLPYHHAIWNLFVLAGIVCHVLATCLYVLP